MAPGLQGFKSTLVYSARATSALLMADVERIAALDARAERLRSIARYMAAAAAMSLLGTLFLRTPVAFLGAKPLAVVAALWLATALIACWRFRRRDLSNRRYGLFGELIKLLGRDMSKDAELQARLDLASPLARRKRGAEGHFKSWKVTHYRDPWLQLSGRLADGTSFRIIVSELSQVRQRWTKSRSGKNKLKTKSKVTTQVAMSLYPKAGRYGNLDAIRSRAMSFLQLPAWLYVKRLEATAEELTLVTATKSEWSLRRIEPRTANDGVEMIARMLLSLYQMLHVSKAASK
jgi:hypothetical protein